MTPTPSFDALQEEWRRVIAYAWTDSAFFKKLLENPREALEDRVIRDRLRLEFLEGNYLPIPNISDAEEIGLPSGSSESEIIEFLRDDEKGTRLFGEMRMSCI